MTRGLFRVALPWPPRAANGAPLPVEFTLEVVRDPTGCNTHPEHGLTSPRPTVSVYRRPRPVANTKYLTHSNFGVGPFIAKSGLPAVRDPDTGLPTSMNMMADARVTTLKAQAADAARTHLGLPNGLPAAALERIVGFEQQIYAAQARDLAAGDLTSRPARLRPAQSRRGSCRCARQQHDALGLSARRRVAAAAGTAPTRNRAARAAAIARGHDVFMFRTFFIRDSMHLNSVGLGNPVEAHVLDVPRHAHDGHGRRQRLDGHRHDESAVGARGAAEPVDDARRRSCRCSR